MKKQMILGCIVGGCFVSSICGTNVSMAQQNISNLTENSYQITEIFSASSMARKSMRGVVTGDGVRLRKDASSNATVLESLEKNEKVIILDDKPKGEWLNVKRVKTGTSGWIHKDYVRIL